MRQTSVPTTASATRQRPRMRKPVANSQWTCSAGGCMFLEVLEQSGPDDEVEDQSDGDHEERRLDDEPPEAFPVRMQQRDAVRLQDRPGDADECCRRAERRDDARGPRPLYRCFEFGYELCVQDVLRWWSWSWTSPRTPCPRAYAGTGGGRTSNATPKRLRGVTSSAMAVRGCGNGSMTSREARAAVSAA